MIVDYGKANHLKRTGSSGSNSSSEQSESHVGDEKVLSSKKLGGKESVDARLDCDLAFIAEETVDGAPLVAAKFAS